MVKTNARKTIALCLMLTLCFGLFGFLVFPSTDTLIASADPETPIYMDYENYSFEERAADLTSRLTLQQKLNQMISSYVVITPASEKIPTGIKSYGWWNEALHGISRIHGYARSGPPTIANTTSYPNGFAMGQTWDPELQYRTATQISDEAREVVPDNDRMLSMYSPTINLARDPRWGRTDETFSEDPILTAAIGAQFVNGLEGKDQNGKQLDPNGYQKLVSTIKHYLANNSEVNRLNGSSNLTEQELREYYSMVYRLIIEKTDVSSVMSSYNRIQIKNPVYSVIQEMPGGINQYTLDTLLRQTFGFTGYVTGDCDSVNIAVAGSGTSRTNVDGSPGAANQTTTSGNGHGWRVPTYTNIGYSATTGGSATITKSQADAWAIMAGAELECNTGYGAGTNSYEASGTAQAAINSGYTTPFGKMTEAAVDLACAKLLEMRIKMGEFDDKTNYGLAGAQQATSSGRVSWYDDARARLRTYGLTPQAPLTTNNNGNTYMNTTTNHQTSTAPRLLLAREAAAKSQVLLKNDIPAGGTKPLLPVNVPATGAFKVAIFGYQANTIVLGGYSSNRNGTYAAQKQTNPVNGIRALVTAKNPNATVDYFNMGNSATMTISAADQTTINGVADYDLCVVVAGDNLNEANEGADRTNLILRRNQALLPAAVMAVNPKTVVCLTAYSPLYLKSYDVDKTTSIFYSGFGGDSYGGGLADVIFGEVNPSARTSTIWAGSDASDTDATSFNNRRSYRLSPGYDGDWVSPLGTTAANLTNTYNYGTSLGRTYMYYNGPVALAYPHGYGLSYTSFEYSNLKVSGATLVDGLNYTADGNATVNVKFDVKNTGTYAGADVPQLYVKTPESLVEADRTYAIKRLKAFEKTKVLAPGETQTISLDVAIKDLMFFSNTAKKFALVRDKGAYEFQISRNSDDASRQLYANVTLSSDHVPELSTLTFKPNTAADVANDVPERLIFAAGDVINANPTVAMTNDVLYGYINKSVTLAPENAMPSNITVTYTSNRPAVVNTSGGTIKALSSGVATITAKAVDSISGTSAEGHFIAYVGGDVDAYDLSLATLTAGGTAVTGFVAGASTASFDINSATPLTIAATATDSDNVTVTIAQATAVPGQAKVTVTRKDYTDIKKEYVINFDTLAVENISGTVDSSGFTVSSQIRFGDGVTAYKLILAAYEGDKLVFIKLIDVPPIPKDTKGEVGASIEPMETGPNYTNYTYKAFLWSEGFVPFGPEFSSTFAG